MNVYLDTLYGLLPRDNRATLHQRLIGDPNFIFNHGPDDSPLGRWFAIAVSAGAAPAAQQPMSQILHMLVLNAEGNAIAANGNKIALPVNLNPEELQQLTISKLKALLTELHIEYPHEPAENNMRMNGGRRLGRRAHSRRLGHRAHSRRLGHRAHSRRLGHRAQRKN